MVFKPPEETVRLGDRDYLFQAGLAAFMSVHSAFEPVYDDDGEAVSIRVGDVSPDAVAKHFHAFCAGDMVDGHKPSVAEWRRIMANSHPMEVLAVWNVCQSLVTEVMGDWQPEDAEDGATFRSEPEEPVASVDG